MEKGIEHICVDCFVADTHMHTNLHSSLIESLSCA